MKMIKERFLKTEFGAEMANCIKCWDKWILLGDHKSACWCQAQWEVYKIALRQFYGVEYNFSRTEEYFGICTDDGSQWLMKVYR